MSDAPKIVRDRLRAAMPRDGHPDADVLTAFAEQALSGAEREDVVRHLARCGDCREVVALSLPPSVEAARPETEMETASTRQPAGRSFTWFAWPTLRWAALAAGVVVVASVLMLRPGKQSDQTVATAKYPAESKVEPAGPAAVSVSKSEIALSRSAVAQPDEKELAIHSRGYAIDRGGNLLVGNQNSKTLPSDAYAFNGRSDEIAMKRNLVLDERKLAAKKPATPAAAATGGMLAEERGARSVDSPAANGAVGEIQSSAVPEKLMARAEGPALPIAKAKPATGEEGTSKSERQDLLSFKESDKASLAHLSSAAPVVLQKQNEKQSADQKRDKDAYARKSAEPLRPEWCSQLPRPEYKNLERVLTDEPWFEVYKIRPGVFAIYEAKQFEEVISYLILGDKRALLFDTGLGVGKISAVVTRLTALPVTIINSHTHFDHVGGNAEFAGVWNRDLPFTQGNMRGQSNAYSSDALAAERLCGSLPSGVNPTSYAIRPWKSSHSLQDGEAIDLGGRTVEVLFTPGHTPDSLMLLDRKNGLLFTGDTFYPGPIYLFVPETDFAAYTRSVNRLAALEPQLKLLLPAHNVPVADPIFLTRLAAAVQQVNHGGLKAQVTEGHREYVFDGFSLLLSAK
ncbi:MAG: MBL fold metallo-hydrolase [Acidobacteria bacterium]|nr:MBL fold metallo-hydrolase [Acidobacteriota bacterium]